MTDLTKEKIELTLDYLKKDVQKVNTALEYSDDKEGEVTEIRRLFDKSRDDVIKMINEDEDNF